jgi:hypothetical protein
MITIQERSSQKKTPQFEASLIARITGAIKLKIAMARSL